MRYLKKYKALTRYWHMGCKPYCGLKRELRKMGRPKGIRRCRDCGFMHFPGAECRSDGGPSGPKPEELVHKVARHVVDFEEPAYTGKYPRFFSSEDIRKYRKIKEQPSKPEPKSGLNLGGVQVVDVDSSPVVPAWRARVYGGEK